MWMNHYITRYAPHATGERILFSAALQDCEPAWTAGKRTDRNCNVFLQFGTFKIVYWQNSPKRLRKLKRKDLEPLTLVVLEGYTQADVAKMAHVTP